MKSCGAPSRDERKAIKTSVVRQHLIINGISSGVHRIDLEGYNHPPLEGPFIEQHFHSRWWSLHHSRGLYEFIQDASRFLWGAIDALQRDWKGVFVRATQQWLGGIPGGNVNGTRPSLFTIIGLTISRKKILLWVSDSHDEGGDESNSNCRLL